MTFNGIEWLNGYKYRVKPKPRKVWLNLGPSGPFGSYYATKSDADSAAMLSGRIACIEVELPPVDGKEGA